MQDYKQLTRSAKREEAVALAQQLARQVASRSKILEVDEDELQWAKRIAKLSNEKYNIILLNLYRQPESYLKEWKECLLNLVSSSAHLYVFTPFAGYSEVSKSICGNEFLEFPFPIIHHITDSMHCPWPDYGPKNSWEMILYAIHGKKAVKHSVPNVIAANGNEQGATRDSTFFINLLSRSCMPDDKVLSLGMRDSGLKKAATSMNINLTFVRKKLCKQG